MRKFNILAAVAATMLVGGVAVAKEKPANAGEKKVCRIEMPAVGRIPEKRVCRTKAEWEAITAEGQRDAARAVEASTGRN
jgi:hypothetical protein